MTNAEGNFVAPQLPPGVYSNQVSKQGFKTARTSGITHQTNETVRRNFQLEVGTVTTAVDVSANAELTNTYTAQLSQTVDQRRVVDLPLNGRDVTQLSLIVAGASVTDASTSFYAGTSGFDTTTAVINGNRTQGNTYLLDGMGNQFMERRVANIYPNPDAVEEFTLNTSQYSAEMGGNPGGQLSAVTKRGTNQLHGSLFRVRAQRLFQRSERVRYPRHDRWPEAQSVGVGRRRSVVHSEGHRWPQSFLLDELLPEHSYPPAGNTRLSPELDASGERSGV
jgi:hypothetical protein